MSLSLTRRLARILQRPVEDATLDRAALHLVDWLGCAVAGAVSPAGRRLGRMAAPGTGACCLGLRVTVSRRDAAFVNGGLGNVLEMDDVHRQAILHPGPVVIPAALAAADPDCSGAALLAAIVRGYEAVIRIGRSVGPGHYAHWHNTATCGPFGAAAAAADLLGLGEDATVWAFGNAGTQSAGPWRCRHEPVMTKQLHTARAAEAGLTAALLAREEFSGPEFILEGAQGFYEAMCPDPLSEAVTAEPESAWLIRGTSFKPWPACRHAHAAIDAALVLRAEGLPDRGTIARIGIETYADAAAFCDRAEPTTTLEAKFSLQHAVAVALLEGPPPHRAFDAKALGAEPVTALRRRAEVRVAEPYAGAYPDHYGSAVTLTLADGSTRRAAVDDALGDPENPLSPERVRTKARDLMTLAQVTSSTAEKALAAVADLPRVKDLGRFDAAFAALCAELDVRTETA